LHSDFTLKVVLVILQSPKYRSTKITGKEHHQAEHKRLGQQTEKALYIEKMNQSLIYITSEKTPKHFVENKFRKDDKRNTPS